MLLLLLQEKKPSSTTIDTYYIVAQYFSQERKKNKKHGEKHTVLHESTCPPMFFSTALQMDSACSAGSLRASTTLRRTEKDFLGGIDGEGG